MANEKRMDQVILGLLSHESMTGYEIKKRLDTRLHFFWGGSYGSIYPTLNGLEKKGFVTKEQAKENGRDKIIYTITKEGHKNLQEWLALPVVKDEMRFETILKIFFGSELGAEGSLKHIEHFEHKLTDAMPFLQKSVEQLKPIADQEQHGYYLLSAMCGVKMYEALLEWCEDAKKILNEKK